MREIIPTIVPESLDDLHAKSAALGAFASVLHIDGADGVFAPNVTWLPAEASLPNAARMFYEVHLMVAEPQSIGVAFVRAGARRIIGHIEACLDAAKVKAAFDAWRAAGAREVGLAVLLETPLDVLEPYIAQCDIVMLMTIATIGKQGIPFEPRSLERVRTLHEKHPELTIAVDGGVAESNIADLARAGAAHFSVGSAITQAADPRAVYNRLLERVNAI